MPMSESPEYYIFDSPFIIVDDSDPAIRYNGTWNAANQTETRNATFPRMPMFNTLHVLQIFNGSFSYDFEGGGISVFATPLENINYTYQCLLDGNQLPFSTSTTTVQLGQSRPVCEAFGLPETAVHTISVLVSVPPQQQPGTSASLPGFAFDYMTIQPPSGASLWDSGNQDVLLPVLNGGIPGNATQPILGFGVVLNDAVEHIADASRYWEFDPQNGFYTTTPGSQFNITFTGTSLWWYGYLMAQSGAISSATFSIDCGTPSSFSTSASLSPSQDFLFRTPVLQYATHLLTVVHHGTNETLPLTLQSLIIQKSTPVVSSSAEGLLPTTTISKLPTPPAERGKGHVGAIVGSIVGAVVLLFVVTSAVCVLSKWARRKQLSVSIMAHHPTVMLEPFPMGTEEGDCRLVPQKALQGLQNNEHPLMRQSLQELPLTKWTRQRAMSRSLGQEPSSSAAVTQRHGAHIRDPADDANSAGSDPMIDEQPDAQMGNVVGVTMPNFNTDPPPSYTAH